MARRRGLAPLELVLWLPILLMVAALFVNFGTMAAWRIRGEIVARDAGWRTHYPRSGQPRPDTEVWPANAGVGAAGADAIAQIDSLDYLEYPEFDPDVVRVFRGPLPYGYSVKDALDPLRGADSGRASITRPYPLLHKMGAYHSGRIGNPLLDDKWQASQMLLHQVRWWTWWSHDFYTRRTLALYEYPPTDPQLGVAYLNAVIPVLAMCRPEDPKVRPVRVLDHDWDLLPYHRFLIEQSDFVNALLDLLGGSGGNQELLDELLSQEEQEILKKCRSYRWVRRYDCPWCRQSSLRSAGPDQRLHFADFHPTVWGCTADPKELYDTQVRGRVLPHRDNKGQLLLGEICSLPHTMTGHYLFVFLAAKGAMKLEISQLQDMLEAVPPPSAIDQQSMRDRIAVLNDYLVTLELEHGPGIEQLKAYLELLEQTLEPQLMNTLEPITP